MHDKVNNRGSSILLESNEHSICRDNNDINDSIYKIQNDIYCNNEVENINMKHRMNN
jgi:hypothetical protein